MISKRKINIKRKEQFNNKLFIQIMFSIVLVTAVIFSKQFKSDLTADFIAVTDEKINENISFSDAFKVVKDFGNSIKDKFTIKESLNDYDAPVKGSIIKEYGLNKDGDKSVYNHGMDIISTTQSVKAIADGKVSVISNNEKLDNYIVIETDEKTIIYSKIKEALVLQGDKVEKGSVIAYLNENDMQLHIEVWESGESINPSRLFTLTN